MHIASLLSCYGLRLTPPTSPPTSSTLQHDIGATATGVLTCEGVRVMSASACACRVRASVFTLHLCHMCKVCTLLTRLCFFFVFFSLLFLMWLFLDMLLVVLSPACQSKRWIIYHIAPWRRQTEPLFESPAVTRRERI